MTEKHVRVSFVDIDVEKKGKPEDERPTVSVMSTANMLSTSGYSTPAEIVTSKNEPDAFGREPAILPSGNFAAAPIVPETSPTSSPEISKKQRKIELMSFCALLWANFLDGWNDGSNGPLIPSMQNHYNINYTIVSLIFVLSCIGFLSGAVANIRMVEKLGFGTTLVIGASSQVVAYCIQAPAPPFPLFVVSYLFAGFGIALQVTGAYVFVINLKNSSAKMGILQASYGLGALVSPLSATKFALMPHWSYHYFTSLGIAVVNIIVLCLVFRFQHLDTILHKSGQVVRDNSDSPKGSLYGQIFKLKAVHLLSFFTLAYVGAEVTIGGWIVTFVINERNGGSSSGYVSSGFFAGLTLGRVTLLWFSKWVGERRVVYLYITFCIALEMTIWFIPSLVGNAIAVAFIGFLLGPIYVIITSVTGKLIPHWLLNGALSWIGGLGQTGSAFMPFITGTLFSKFGVMSLQPVIVSVLSAMLLLWAAIPREVRHSK